jgi:hypothetical protein
MRDTLWSTAMQARPCHRQRGHDTFVPRSCINLDLFLLGILITARFSRVRPNTPQRVSCDRNPPAKLAVTGYRICAANNCSKASKSHFRTDPSNLTMTV